MTDTQTSAETFTVQRDGDRDVSFEGVELGTGSYGTGGTSGYRCDWNRGTEVTLYRTQGGRYVISVLRWSRWQGENDIHRAAVLDDAQAVLDWMVEDCGGRLGRASKESLQAASAEDEGIAGILVESLE